MDTGEAGVQPRQPGEKVNLKRGKSSSKQARGSGGGHLGLRRCWWLFYPQCICCWFVRVHIGRPMSLPPLPQKERKRKSLEKALAVASQAETKVTKTAAREGSKKSLKKLWQNSREDKD